jgi:xanthine dehydrogenase accessory factor
LPALTRIWDIEPLPGGDETIHTQDFEVIRQALAWCEANEQPWLCTIVSATGSSPRPVGSLLAALASGLQVGSLSGGCVEEDLLTRLHRGEFDRSATRIVEYGVSAEENERLGLPCGGRMEILVQSLTAADCSWLETLLAAMERRQCVMRQLNLTTCETTVSPIDHYHDLALAGEQLRQCFGPRMRLLLVGAGQLAQSLAELALAMDYEVLVTDTRAQVLSQWEGPSVPLLQGMPDDIVREHASDRHCIIITLTHDPRIDDMALMEALGTEAWYVGALGSRRTTDKRLQRLRQLELPEAQIARLHAPVGLDIGSKTPNEIAISIMAELTMLRRRGT